MHRINTAALWARWALAALALSLVLSTASGRAHHTNAGADIDTDIKAFVAAYLELLENGDIDAVLEQYVADERFSWFTDGQRLYKTPNDVAVGLAEVRASGLRLQTETSGVEVVPLTERLATVRAEFQTRALLVEDGAGEQEVFAYAGVMTMLVERSEGGVWKIVEGHASTPGGPPAD